MKSTHNTAWAYTKGAAATLAMVTGTALLMAACGTVGRRPRNTRRSGSTIRSRCQRAT